MNNRGLVQQMIVILVMIGVLMALIVGYFAWSLIAPLLVSTGNELTGALQNVTQGDQNLSVIVNNTIVPLNTSVSQNLEWISYSLLVFLMLGFFLCCFFVRTYPFLLVFWLGFNFVIAFASIYMSSSYSDLLRGSDAAALAYQSWQANSFIITNLPAICIAIGVLGGIILFVLLTKDPEAELVTA